MKKNLLDQLRDEIRVRHYSIRTKDAYTQWVNRFILFHHKRHPAKMGAKIVTVIKTKLLTSLCQKPKTD